MISWKWNVYFFETNCVEEQIEKITDALNKSTHQLTNRHASNTGRNIEIIVNIGLI